MLRSELMQMLIKEGDYHSGEFHTLVRGNKVYAHELTLWAKSLPLPVYTHPSIGTLFGVLKVTGSKGKYTRVTCIKCNHRFYSLPIALEKYSNNKRCKGCSSV